MIELGEIGFGNQGVGPPDGNGVRRRHNPAQEFAVEDQAFIDRLQQKIERLTGRMVELRIDQDDGTQMQEELGPEVPVVILGRNILEYAGFARMGVEYAVASIREQRAISPIEFQLLLARN